MNVRWSYEGLQFQHTPQEVDDETAWDWQPIPDSELIIHAANLHLFRTGGFTPDEQPLWLDRNGAIPFFEDFKCQLTTRS
jgi:hypothetical protein